jgi:hypothetical protein
VSDTRRSKLFTALAEATRSMLHDVQREAFSEVPRWLAVRQRIIEEARSLDGGSVKLGAAERATLEAARVDERRALELLAAKRQTLLNSFRELARGRRAAGGYRPGASPAARFMDRMA